MTCVATTLETLGVLMSGGDGSDTITSDPAGIDCVADCTAQFPIDNNVTLTAHPSGTDAFTGWGGACSGTGSCTVKMSGTQNVTAQFAVKHTLSFAVSVPAGEPLGQPVSADVTIQPGGYSRHFTTGTFGDDVLIPDGVNVVITANANGVGGTPVTWTGACANAVGNTCVVFMNSDQSFGVQVNLS